jgi:hypothetical protein
MKLAKEKKWGANIGNLPQNISGPRYLSIF